MLPAIRGEDDEQHVPARRYQPEGLDTTATSAAAEAADTEATEATGELCEGSSSLVEDEVGVSTEWSDGGTRTIVTSFARLESVWQAALRRPGGATGMHAREVAKATAVFAEGLLALHESFLTASKCLSDQVTCVRVFYVSQRTRVPVQFIYTLKLSS